MKKIILIGDSIRLGYDKYVKEALSGVAEVYYPDENCRFAEYVLRYAHTWKSELGWPEDADLGGYELPLIFGNVVGGSNLSTWKLVVDGEQKANRIALKDGKIRVLHKGTVLILR